jgi:hypothetical protein
VKGFERGLLIKTTGEDIDRFEKWNAETFSGEGKVLWENGCTYEESLLQNKMHVLGQLCTVE